MEADLTVHGVAEQSIVADYTDRDWVDCVTELILGRKLS